MGLGEEGLLVLLVPLALASGIWVCPMYENCPGPPGLGQDGRGVEVFLHFHLSRRHLDPGKGKRGMKHSGRSLCGPCQELDTGHIYSRAGPHGPGELSRPCGPMDKQCRGLTLPTGTPCVGGCREAQERTTGE